MDFCRGVVEMAQAIQEKRPNRLSKEFCLHNNELVNAISNALENNNTYQMTTTFAPMQPMDWSIG
jgi:hypothetical protein